MKKKFIASGLFFIVVSTLIVGFLMNSKTPTKVLQLNSLEADENGLYYAEDYAFKEMDPYEEAYIHNMSEKLNRTYETILNSDMKVYYSVIPDKGYFIENPSYGKEDYENMLDTLNNEVEHMEYIPIFDQLSIEDYYKTDHHWRQDKLFPVVKQLGSYMDFEVNSSNFKENVSDDFQGVFSQYMGEIPEESFVYMTSSVTEDATIKRFDEGTYEGVYFLEQLEGEDPYEVFLNGLSPMIILTNPHATSDRELILFGDSYASSIAPLMLEAYAKITFVDLRFVFMSYLPEVIEFDTQDVLFLYNTAVINRSVMLKFQ